MGDDRDFKNDWTDCVPITDHSNSDEPNGEVDEDKVCPIWLWCPVPIEAGLLCV